MRRIVDQLCALMLVLFFTALTLTVMEVSMAKREEDKRVIKATDSDWVVLDAQRDVVRLRKSQVVGLGEVLDDGKQVLVRTVDGTAWRIKATYENMAKLGIPTEVFGEYADAEEAK